MESLWSQENRYRVWLEVELRACEAMEKVGIVPQGVSSRLRERIKIDPRRISEIEKVTRHDVVAFLVHLQEQGGEESRYLHLGLTSSDVLDTSLAILLREATEIILQALGSFMECLKDSAYQYKMTPLVGRTHGIHAEPITLGLTFALWYEEAKRNYKRLKNVQSQIQVGKLKGAVGTYAHLSPEIEAIALEKLGLLSEPISTQIVQRDRYAEYFSVLALLGCFIEKIALTVRHWQRTEVGEAEEGFKPGQKGSSAMPHKKNPILSENLCGLARMLRAYVHPAMENIALWHERDISHSSVERIIGPDATTLAHFMLKRAKELMLNLKIYPERLEKNLALSKGLIFSEAILSLLIIKGQKRQDAYTLVQKCAQKALAEDKDFQTLILNDPKIKTLLSKEEIKKVFEIKWWLRYIDVIFERVFS
jgi:adenylosuccinate lyase